MRPIDTLSQCLDALLWEANCKDELDIDLARLKVIHERLRAIHDLTRWIPVSERMPEKDDHVLVFGIQCNELFDDDTFQSVGAVSWDSVEHSYCPDTCYYGVWYKDITHWKHITPPEGV